MNDTNLLNRLAEANGYGNQTPLPEAIWTSDLALREIERRTGMDTHEETSKQTATGVAAQSETAGTSVVVSQPAAPRRSWNPVLVGAAAFAVVVIVGAAILLVSQVGDDVANGAPLTPLEVGEALNEATVTGDTDAIRLLYADDATLTDVMGNPHAALLEPSNYPYETDWDGDGELTIFDETMRNEAEDYAAGVTLAHTCTQIDSTTVVCEEVVEGHAFFTDEARSTFQATNTFTVENGQITHRRHDGGTDHLGGTEGKKWDEELYFEYRDWVVAKVGLEQRDLFDSGIVSVRRDTVERQRELIAEWVAQR